MHRPLPIQAAANPHGISNACLIELSQLVRRRDPSELQKNIVTERNYYVLSPGRK